MDNKLIESFPLRHQSDSDGVEGKPNFTHKELKRQCPASRMSSKDMSSFG